MRKPPDTFSPSQLSLISQHPCTFYWLWVVRAVVGIISCLVPMPPMWMTFVWEQSQPAGFVAHAVPWASIAVVACISGSIISERLLYVGFADHFGGEQVACVSASATAIAMLITGEFIHSIPLPLVWSLGGCALQRLSMVVWWWLTVRKASGNEDFRTRAQMTFVGHVFSLLSVFMVFLPMFDARLNQMLWLFACFFAIELFTTILTVRATYLVFQPEELPSSELQSMRPSMDRNHRPSSPDHALPGVPLPVKNKEYTLSQMLREK